MILPPGGHGSGTVGADGFVQGNDRFIVFKNSIAVAPEQTAHIALQKVEANGYTTIGDCEEMVHSFPNGDNDTEGPAVVANPSNNGFVVFFVVGFYKNTDYRNDYATADQITGPYQRQGMLLKTGTYQGVNIKAPGGPDFMGTSAREIISMGDKDSSYELREMYTAQLTYDGHSASLATE
jgi:hypothetical protein